MRKIYMYVKDHASSPSEVLHGWRSIHISGPVMPVCFPEQHKDNF